MSIDDHLAIAANNLGAAAGQESKGYDESSAALSLIAIGHCLMALVELQRGGPEPHGYFPYDGSVTR